jgi:division protein CdvB (Snf7/Vps24/ESCRT-III family)
VIAEDEIYDNILNDHPEIFMETYEEIMPDELNTDYEENIEENFQEYIPEEYLEKDYLYDIFNEAIIENISVKLNEKIENLIDEGEIESADQYNYYDISQ